MGLFSALSNVGDAAKGADPRILRSADRLGRRMNTQVRVTQTDSGVMADFKTEGEKVQRPSTAVFNPDGRVKLATLREDPPTDFYPEDRTIAAKAAEEAARRAAREEGFGNVTAHIGQENAPHAVVKETIQLDEFLRFEESFRAKLRDLWPTDELYIGDPPHPETPDGLAATTEPPDFV